MSECTDFQKQIYALVQAIPRGETMTYGQVAERAGKPGAARAVGRVMATNPFAILVPCHRVVAKSGPGRISLGQRDEGEAAPSGKGIEFAIVLV